MNNKINDAILFATEAHSSQRRKGAFKDIHYISHIFEVQKRVTAYFQDVKMFQGITVEDIIVSAILHDVIEDTIYTEADIQVKFGRIVTGLVLEMTRPKGADKYSWLVDFKTKSLASIIVKIADRYCNVMDFKLDVKKKEYVAFYALNAYPLFCYFEEKSDSKENEFYNLNKLVKVDIYMIEREISDNYDYYKNSLDLHLVSQIENVGTIISLNDF